MKINEMSKKGHEVFDLHIKVLRDILVGRPFDQIQQKYEQEFLETNYIDIVKKCGHLSFNEDGGLIGAYPISPSKTDFHVTIEGVGQGYSMCAIDAMGIPFLFMKKTIIEALDKSKNTQIKITIDPTAEHQEILSYFVTYQETPEELQGSNSAAVVQCPTINFYSSKDRIHENLHIWTYEKALEYSQMRFGRREMLSRIQNVITQL
jgi:hypothetical protein